MQGANSLTEGHCEEERIRGTRGYKGDTREYKGVYVGVQNALWYIDYGSAPGELEGHCRYGEGMMGSSCSMLEWGFHMQW